MMMLKVEVNGKVISKVAAHRTEDQNDSREYRYEVFDVLDVPSYRGIREGELLGQFWHHPSESTSALVEKIQDLVSEEQYDE